MNGALVEGFLYEGKLRPAAWLDGAGNVKARFVYGPRVNVPEYVVTTNGTYRIVTDHLGSPRLVIDATTGAIAQRVDYDEWGKVTSDSNPGFQPFGFAGGLWDRDTGLVRFGARDYEPQTGRWTNKDRSRFGGGLNFYAYCDDDPVNFVDTTGHMKLPADPSSLPPEWTHDPTHKDPSGSRWRHPNGDYLDFHQGRPGETGWKGKDHWHHNGEPEHLKPGKEIPDPDPVCEDPQRSGPPADEDNEFVLPYDLEDYPFGPPGPVPVLPLPGPLPVFPAPFPFPAFVPI